MIEAEVIKALTFTLVQIEDLRMREMTDVAILTDLSLSDIEQVKKVRRYFHNGRIIRMTFLTHTGTAIRRFVKYKAKSWETFSQQLGKAFYLQPEPYR
jgi:hypothetical protein